MLALTACNKYQFVTINSDLKKSEKGKIIFENDSFAVRYQFSGADGPVRLELINKTSTPIYLKWTPSSLTKQTWPNNGAPVFSAAAPSPEKTKDNSVAIGYNKSVHPEQLIACKPFDFTGSKAIPIRKAFFHISTPELRSEEMNGARVRLQYFNRQNTPMLFISELSIFSTDESLISATTLKHEFWVDEVLVTMIRPEQVHHYKGRHDMFYTRKGSGLGVFLASIGFFTYFAASRASD
jgi:hypothetical protein